jgi:radical SAM protein with 4Fe4S-binding SPASM domain
MRCYTYTMKYYLSRRAALKWLETPSVYQIAKDELYELDSESFRFIKDCATQDGCTSKDGAFIDYCLEEGILTTQSGGVRHPAIRQAAEPSLRYLELQITDACNLACKHCYIGEGNHHELSLQNISGLLREFEEMQGLRVLITGGEPLLHSKFNEINELLPEFQLRKVLFTNGVLLDKTNIKSLKVDEIQVSIDGLEPAHDTLRGNGTFKRALEAMEHALGSGFDVSVSTMVHRENLADFNSLERLFKGMGIRDWTVDIPCSTGRFLEHPEFHIGPEEGGEYLGYGYGGGIHSSTQGFGCGLHLMAVLADGKIAKCAFYGDQPVGSVDQGLQAAWNKVRPIRLKDLRCDCEYLEVCRGGCRYRAELTEGKDGKDLYRCMLYGIIDSET